MKITKRQLKRIIREERQNLKEAGNIHGDKLSGLANASVAQIENIMDQWDLPADYDIPGGADPRADQVYDLLFQVRERMMAILENRE